MDKTEIIEVIGNLESETAIELYNEAEGFLYWAYVVRPIVADILLTLILILIGIFLYKIFYELR